MQRRTFCATVASSTAFSLAPGRPAKVYGDDWPTDGVGTIARLGVLTPDFDPVPESELWAMAPRGVSIHASRVARGAGGGAAFVDPPRIDEAIDRLVELAPRAILLGFTSSSYALGAEADAGVHARLEQRAKGIPVIFPAVAAVSAFRERGIQRVSLIHPPWWSETTNDQGRAYWRAAGFEVVNSLRLEPARSFAEVAPREVFEFVSAHTPRAAQAVFIGGNGMRAIGTIKKLEARLDKPVLSANQILLWEALRTVSAAPKVRNYGRIWENL